MTTRRAEENGAASGGRLATSGLHHVTALSEVPQACVDFYAGALALHLVKRTVNFDDPATHHLYFGGASGDPGTLITVFAWPGAGHGRRGTGQVASVAFAVPPGSLGYWMDRLAGFGVEFEPLPRRFGDEVLTFTDPDGLALELIAAGGEAEAAAGETAIMGLHSVTLSVRDAVPTAHMLTAALGLSSYGAEAGRQRFIAEGSAQAGVGASAVDIVADPAGIPGVIAGGAVHHVAFRAADDEEQQRWRLALAAAGLSPSRVVDRKYFSSIYFHDPGGVLCEIATDLPGFAIDEPPDNLGTALKLPAWLEPMRDRLERRLSPVRAPAIPTGPPPRD